MQLFVQTSRQLRATQHLSTAMERISISYRFHKARDVAGGLSAGLYEYFHDAELHKPDDLGNYSENYRLREPVDRQAELASNIVFLPPELPRDLYEYLHDADLHKPDELGTYAQNLRHVYHR